MSPADPQPHPRPWRVWLRHATTLTLLLAAGGLLTETVREATAHANLNAAPPLEPITDPAERQRRLRDFFGTFATGSEPGDRLLTIDANGRVRFALLGPLRGPLEDSDTYDIGMRGDHPYLNTRQNGRIDMLEIDQLSYFGDTYRRRPN